MKKSGKKDKKIQIINTEIGEIEVFQVDGFDNNENGKDYFLSLLSLDDSSDKELK